MPSMSYSYGLLGLLIWWAYAVNVLGNLELVPSVRLTHKDKDKDKD